MHRNPDGSGLVGDGTGDGLPDPPGGICREFVSLCPVKLVHRPDQACVALLDQIQDVQTPAGILLGDGNHQPEVGFRQLVLGRLIPLGDPLGKLHFFLGAQQLHLADFLQVHPHGIVQGILGGQVNGVNQLLLFQAAQVDVPVVHGQGVVVQLQLRSDQRDTHGLEPVVNLFNFIRGQLELFQLGVQIRQPDHTVLLALGDQGLQSGLNLFHVGIFLFRCAHRRYPSFMCKSSKILMPLNYTLFFPVRQGET